MAGLRGPPQSRGGDHPLDAMINHILKHHLKLLQLACIETGIVTPVVSFPQIGRGIPARTGYPHLLLVLDKAVVAEGRAAHVRQEERPREQKVLRSMLFQASGGGTL